jgi:AAA domain
MGFNDLKLSQVILDDTAIDQYQEQFAELAPVVQDALLGSETTLDLKEAAKSVESKLNKDEAELEALLSRFKTIKDLFANGEEETKWLVPKLIPEKALISFQGRAKAGKSVLVFHILKALLTGGEFLGDKLPPTKVVYLSEEPRPAFKEQLQKAGVDQTSENLAALTVEDNHGLNWDKTFQLTALKLKAFGAKLLIIDSWGRFAQFSVGEDEMSPAPTQRRITALRSLMAQTGAAILIIQHVTKDNSRGLIDSGMGSSALAQQVDLALSLSGEPKQPEVQANKLLNENCRAIQGIGRFGRVDAFAVELKEGNFIPSSFKEKPETSETDLEDAKTFLLDYLSDHVDHLSTTMFDVAEAQGISKDALYKVRESLSIKCGKNGKGGKFTWRLPSEAPEGGKADFSSFHS